jgi:hypothetical protein
VIVLSRGSGGGYGDVLERDPEAVATDVREDLIDDQVARGIYGVILGEDGLPDPEATAERRAEIRRERLARGRTYADFMRTWAPQRPPAQALKWYGRYPIPESADLGPGGPWAEVAGSGTAGGAPAANGTTNGRGPVAPRG